MRSYTGGVPIPLYQPVASRNKRAEKSAATSGGLSLQAPETPLRYICHRKRRDKSINKIDDLLLSVKNVFRQVSEWLRLLGSVDMFMNIE